jgi:RNA polymerase sigma factor (TIGR02999 family)
MGKTQEAGSPVRDVTTLLVNWQRGDHEALDQLIPLVHAELRRVARRQMAREEADNTLQATALVNEAYVRLVDLKKMRWQNRAHFFAMASRLMRRVLVDAARSRRYQKRGGGARQVALDEEIVAPPRPADLIALDDALEAMAAVDPRKAQMVELRFFGGLSVDEAAEVLGVCRETVLRDWKAAKAWLLQELRRPDDR